MSDIPTPRTDALKTELAIERSESVCYARMTEHAADLEATNEILKEDIESYERNLTLLTAERDEEKLKRQQAEHELDCVIESLAHVGAERDRATNALHERCIHPDYEYCTTTGQRKCWDGEPDLTKSGWELNKTTESPDAFERFEYHEEMYWRRKRAALAQQDTQQEGE